MSTPPTHATPSGSDAGSGPPGVDLRLAGNGELAAVGRLTVLAYVGDGYVDAADDYVEELGDAAARARDAELWVATEAAHPDRLLGTVTFCAVGSPLRELGRDGEGEFRMLAVAPEARGRGVGRALVDLMVRRSRELGYAGVRMSTMEEMAAAHRVYERLGFTRAPEDDWSPVPGVSLLAYAARLDVQGGGAGAVMPAPGCAT